MEVYKQLGADLQMHVLRLHMQHNVLPQVVENANIYFCMMCACNGMPCVHCACDRYCGLHGPAKHNGVRVVILDDAHSDSAHSNMINYMLCRRVAVQLVTSVYDLFHLETTRYPRYSCFSVI